MTEIHKAYVYGDPEYAAERFREGDSIDETYKNNSCLGICAYDSGSIEVRPNRYMQGYCNIREIIPSCPYPFGKRVCEQFREKK